MDTLHEGLCVFQCIPQNSHLTPIYFLRKNCSFFNMIKKKSLCYAYVHWLAYSALNNGLPETWWLPNSQQRFSKYTWILSQSLIKWSFLTPQPFYMCMLYISNQLQLTVLPSFILNHNRLLHIKRNASIILAGKQCN